MVTTGQLLAEMIDMHALTRIPKPWFRTTQFSSYDRTSRIPGGPGWFNNDDGFGKEPIPNFEAVLREPGDDGVGEYLVCDVEGPGAIVRTWTAAITGTLRVELDGELLYDGDARPFLLKPYSCIAPEGVDAKPFQGTLYQRNAAYCPMPYAKRCRIVWTGNVQEIHFYEVQVRTYEDGAEVQTFTPEDLTTYADELAKTCAVLADPSGAWDYAGTQAPMAIDASPAPDTKAAALELDGPAAIERLTLKLEADDVDAALRQTILHITFDGHVSAQVQAPLGDFFGAAPGINPFESVPFSVNADGTMTCRYVMPFASKAEIAFENLGQQSVKVTGEVLPTSHEWTEASMHFRARWRTKHDIESLPIHDMPYLVANGTGRYVGTAVYLLNPNPVPSPGGSWWGEGDEKIFQDDDIHPSIFGTGSEDYFNYAWSFPGLFIHPYCAQPRDDGPANRGFVTNTRWHILDSLPFKYRLSFYMELWPHENNRGMAYARIGYHYGRPGMMDDHEPITREDVRKQVIPDWQPAARKGAADSFFLNAEDIAKGANTQLADHHLAAGGKLLRWQPEKVGETLDLAFEVEETRKYALSLIVAQDPEAGDFSATVDGSDVGYGGDRGKSDNFRPHRRMLHALGIATAELEAGKHTLTLRYEGGPDEAKPYGIGIDFLWVQRK